jgi:hypothetical protein
MYALLSHWAALKYHECRLLMVNTATMHKLTLSYGTWTSSTR